MDRIKTINLKFYLMSLIILIASVCLMSAAIYVAYQSHARITKQTIDSADSIDKQLEVRLVFGAGKGVLSPSFFTNFDFWFKSEQSSNLCVRFEQPNGKVVKRACRGSNITEQWPDWFEHIYLWVFNAGKEVIRSVTYHGKNYGSVIVLPHVETELGQAWHDIKMLMGLSGITILSLCILLYFAVEWALRPARTIVKGLEKMAKENLSYRVPYFTLAEWQQTGQAINHLAESLEKTLYERDQLALKLINSQEEERRYLARELHDEFGQSLAGLLAVAASINQTAEKECPKLLPDGLRIGRIATEMMKLLRDMLIRLRPADIDELGLVASLQVLIADWNAQSGGKTSYKLDLAGNFDQLPNGMTVNLFRIIQECLTNISKHSAAHHATVKLEKIAETEVSSLNQSEGSISLTITDDGVADSVTFFESPGIGLLGMRERANALGGRLILKANSPSGLITQVWIPIQKKPELEA